MSNTRTVLQKRVTDLRARLAAAEKELRELRRNAKKEAAQAEIKAIRVRIATPTTIDNELMNVLKRRAGYSMRAQQRAVAAYLSIRQEHTPKIPREVLRAYCKALRIYDTATFSYYMADERHWRKGIFFVEVAGGWSLTPAGEAEAARLFPTMKAWTQADGTH